MLKLVTSEQQETRWSKLTWTALAAAVVIFVVVVITHVA